MDFFKIEQITKHYYLVKITSIAILGGILLFWISKKTQKILAKKVSPQTGMIFGKLILYLGFTIILVSVLSELGFKLTTLLGAAGVLGVALGFASQTSMSNIISGLFLITEQPFKVDDVISLNETKGIVTSIDMLSIKLRTFDNKLVRIPNEVLIKSEITNLTKYPIRRIDIPIGIAYKEDINSVKNILMEIAKNNPLCLNEPTPVVLIKDFGDSSINLMLLIWVEKTNWIKVKSEVLEQIKIEFDKNNVEIPFPHLTIYKGAETEPFPINIINKE